MLLRGKRLKSVLVLAVFFVSMGLSMVNQGFSALDITESEAVKKELKQKNAELKKELEKSKSEVKKEGDRKAELDRQISLLEKQIDNSNKYILMLEEEIKQLEDRIEALNEDMETKIEILKESLYNIYVAGDVYAIDIILQAKTFEDFLDKAEMMRSISDTINGIITQLNEDLVQIEQDKLGVETKRSEAKTEMESLTKNQDNLQTLFDESEVLLSELKDKEKDAQHDLDENDEELKRIENEIRQYYHQQKIKAEQERKRREEERRRAANSETVSTYVDNTMSPGDYSWPVPGFYYISSDYYDTVNRGGNMHGAIDIAGGGKSIYGAKVVAVADGEVIFSNASGYGGGYGIYTTIDHGGGKATLYAHLSLLAVQKGQKVKKGQVIGYVGSTGHSTGPHLHFETLLYGRKYNPMTEYRK